MTNGKDVYFWVVVSKYPEMEYPRINTCATRKTARCTKRALKKMGRDSKISIHRAYMTAAGFIVVVPKVYY